MEPLVVPETILLSAYQHALRFIRRDYKHHIADVSKSYLGQLLGSTNGIQRYNFIDQAKSVFITDENDPRNIEVNVFFNAKRAAIPTIHITNASETQSHNAVNISTGFEDPIFDDASGTYTDVFNRRFKARYNIVITSDNINEVLLIYNIMLSMSISLIEHLSLAGLEDVKVSGQDIQLKMDVPPGLFVKSIGIEFERDVMALKLQATDFSTIDDFIGDGVPEQVTL